MSALWVNGGIDYAAQLFLNKASAGNLVLHLDTEAEPFLVTDTIADVAEVAAGTYAPVTMLAANWTGSTVGGLATYTYPTITFTLGVLYSGVTVNKYYVTNAAGALAFGDNLSTPFTVPIGGGTVSITPTYQDQKF